MDKTAASMLFKDIPIGGLFHDGIGKGIGIDSDETHVTIYEKVNKSNGDIVKADWSPRHLGVTHRFSPFQRVWIIEKLPDYDTRQGLKAKEAGMDKIAEELVKVAKSLVSGEYGERVVMLGRDEAFLKQAIEKAKENFLDRIGSVFITIPSFKAHYREYVDDLELTVSDVNVKVDGIPAPVSMNKLCDNVFDALDNMNVQEQVSMDIYDLAISEQAIDMIIKEFGEVTRLDDIPVEFNTWTDRGFGRGKKRETRLSVEVTLKHQGGRMVVEVDEANLKDDVHDYIYENYSTDDVDTSY